MLGDNNFVFEERDGRHKDTPASEPKRYIVTLDLSPGKVIVSLLRDTPAHVIRVERMHPRPRVDARALQSLLKWDWVLGADPHCETGSARP
jgi:hypothetical protein